MCCTASESYEVTRQDSFINKETMFALRFVMKCNVGMWATWIALIKCSHVVKANVPTKFLKNNLCNLFIQANFFIPPLTLNVSCVLQKRCVPSTKHDEKCSLVKNIDAIIKTFICLLNRQNTCFFYNNSIHQSSSCSGSQPYPSSPSSGSYWHPSGIPTCGTGTNQSVGRPSRAKAARPASTASCEFVIAKSP